MSADALLEYFAPLYEYLTEQNNAPITQEEVDDYINIDFQLAAVKELGAIRQVGWQFDVNMGTTSAAKVILKQYIIRYLVILEFVVKNYLVTLSARPEINQMLGLAV